MARRSKARNIKLPDLAAGSWAGEIVGKGSAYFGQEVQAGPRAGSVEFSYMIMPATLTMPGGFDWPGALMIMAPARSRVRRKKAGRLFRNTQAPGLMLALDVSRAQFSDMVRIIEAGRFGKFHFTIEEGAANSWPVRSWGLSACFGPQTVKDVRAQPRANGRNRDGLKICAPCRHSECFKVITDREAKEWLDVHLQRHSTRRHQARRQDAFS